MFWVFLIIFSIVVAVFASSRGRSPIGWFFLSALISPLLAGVILALLKDLTVKTEIDVVDHRTENLEQEVRFNQKYNGLRSEHIEKQIENNRKLTENILISGGVQAPLLKLNSETSNHIECPNCFNMNKPDAKFCSVCGNYLFADYQIHESCPNCGTNLGPGTKYTFCPKCGYKLFKECDNCSTKLPVNASFCPNCGKKQNSFMEKSESPNITTGELVLVEGGSFSFVNKKLFGFSKVYIDDRKLIKHRYDFYIGKYLVTSTEFERFCREKKDCTREFFSVQRKFPISNVKKSEAIAYCNWLSDFEGIHRAYDENDDLIDSNGNRAVSLTEIEGYRLPTSQEWLFAASGGIHSKNFKYAGSDNINEVSWYLNNSDKTSHEVGMKAPNELGIYDMNGNLWEWSGESVIGGSHYVFGGSYLDSEESISINIHQNLPSDSANPNIGFRVVKLAKASD